MLRCVFVAYMIHGVLDCAIVCCVVFRACFWFCVLLLCLCFGGVLVLLCF